jgi:diguanylate cyclase (GGDEF)-like protein/PAS domain S-box-containing protein
VRIQFQGDECFMVGFADVTAQKVAEDAIRQGAQNLRTLFAAAPVALILSRISDQTVVLANQRAADLFEVPLEQVVGEKTPDYYVDREQRDRIVHELVRDGHAEDTATHLRTRSGKHFWASLSARLVDFEDQPCFLVGVSDVTPQKQLEAQLRELATRDALTGVWNRRHFAELAQHELQRVALSGQSLAMCRLDADHFKQVNDEHGHAAGDRVLIAIARAAESVMRSSDVLARVGGEEFDVLLPNTDAQGAAQLAERIRSAIAAVVVTTDRGEHVSPRVSVGVAAHREGDDFESMLRRADDALYRAKQAGRDRTVVS